MITPAKPIAAAAEAKPIELTEVVAPLGRHWLRFLLLWAGISAVCLALGAQLSPSFKSEGTVYLDKPTDHSGVGADSSLPSMLSMLGSSSDLDSQKGILKTNDMALSIIRELGINAKLDGPEVDLPDRPFEWQYYLDRDPNRFRHGLFIRDSDTLDNVYHKLRYTLHFKDATSFEVLQNDKPVGAGKIGQPTTTPEARFTLAAYSTPNLRGGEDFKLTLQPAQVLLIPFLGNLEIEGGGRLPRQNNLITITFTSGSPFESQRVAEVLTNQLVELNRRWATEVSRKVVEFVSGELGKIRKDMDDASEKLAQNETKMGVPALDKDMEAEVKSLVEAQVDLDKSSLQVMGLKELSTGLDSGRADMFLLSFVNDPVLEGLGKELTEVNGKIDAMKVEFSPEYTPLKELEVGRARILQDMKSNVANSLDRAQHSIEQSGKVLATYKNQVIGVPEQARVLADFKRSSLVFQELYIFMLKEEQKAQIAEGSTLSSIRVVDVPLVPIKESFPGPMLLVGVCAALGLLASATLIIVPALRVRWFTSVEEVKAAFELPVFAVVPHRGSSPTRASPAIIETRLQSPFIESIRLLRTNLQHTMAGRKHQTVLVTSAMPQDGKSSVTTNLAIALARSERINRVLLVDADMHYPSLHGIFGLRQSPGLSDYLNGSATIEEVTQSVDFGAGRQLQVICAGPVPPSPVELIDSQAMLNLLAFAKEQYTFAIIDTPPYPLVTTASILAPLADRVLSLCRLGHTERVLYRSHVEDLASLCKHVGLIVNLKGLGKRHGNAYGYGYSYGSGYGQKRNAKANAVSPAAPGSGHGAAAPAAVGGNGNGNGTHGNGDKGTGGGNGGAHGHAKPADVRSERFTAPGERSTTTPTSKPRS